MFLNMTIISGKFASLCFLPFLLVASGNLSPWKNFDVIQIENRPFEYGCILTGTEEELNKSTIRWYRPDQDSTDILIPPGGDSHGNITVERNDGRLISTLHVRRPPLFITGVQHYQCKVRPSTPGEINQYTFAIVVLKEKAVPKLQLKTTPAKFRETVFLNCSASYENDNSNAEYDLIMSWSKAGKTLAVETYKYKTGKNIETVRHSLVVKSLSDVGEYVCSWELKSKFGTSISRNSTVDLSFLPYLAGPSVKEVFGILGNNVKIVCDVIGYPIKFEWRDEKNNLINGSDSRIRTDQNVLYVDEMDHEDRQKYKCLGISGDKTLLQTIILRAKGASSSSNSGINFGVVIGIPSGVLVMVMVSVLIFFLWKRGRGDAGYAQPPTKLSALHDGQ